MTTKFLVKDTAPLYTSADGNKKILNLLWGDQLAVLEAGDPRSKVRARGKTANGNLFCIHQPFIGMRVDG